MNTSKAAFARLEITAILSAVLLLFAITAPMLGSTRSDSSRAGCYNNLRQLGIAIHRWAGDHDDRVPWSVLTNEGGSRFSGKTAVGWTEFLPLSNELRSARILACPQDNATKVADDFSTGSRGFLNSGFRGNALSYSVYYDSNLSRPQSMVLSDRDFSTPGVIASCSVGGNGVHSLNFAPGVNRWTNAVHKGFGHVLSAHGGVSALDSRQFTTNAITGDDNGSVHFAPPR